MLSWSLNENHGTKCPRSSSPKLAGKGSVGPARGAHPHVSLAPTVFYKNLNSLLPGKNQDIAQQTLDFCFVSDRWRIRQRRVPSHEAATDSRLEQGTAWNAGLRTGTSHHFAALADLTHRTDGAPDDGGGGGLSRHPQGRSKGLNWDRGQARSPCPRSWAHPQSHTSAAESF